MKSFIALTITFGAVAFFAAVHFRVIHKRETEPRVWTGEAPIRLQFRVTYPTPRPLPYKPLIWL